MNTFQASHTSCVHLNYGQYNLNSSGIDVFYACHLSVGVYPPFVLFLQADYNANTAWELEHPPWDMR
jgi:hypothetical protein